MTILDTIGHTPLILLPHYSTKHIKIYAKLEGTNPGGSIKDRVALFLIRNAVGNKLISNKTILIEATSGNTGIGLAMIAAIYKIPFTAVMPESVSVERRKLLQSYGAKILLTDGQKGTNYAIEVANKMAVQKKNFLMLNQFTNRENVNAHFQTGDEIVKQLPTITHFVAGMGTGGTLMGVSKRLKIYKQSIRIIGLEPIPSSTIQGLRNMAAYNPPIFDSNRLDQKLTIHNDAVAFQLSRDLAKNEGLSVGISSGAALWGALEVAKQIKKGTIVTVFPDRGDRYISTKLFSD